MPSLAKLQLSNSFATLPADFYTKLMPSGLPAPYLVGASATAAQLIGLDAVEFTNPNFAELFAGNRQFAGSQPLAAVYSGHQFGVWAGQLGDGRALLLGDVDATSSEFGTRIELQLKGAGATPYSRGADGRAVLRSSIRELLCSEAMAALGIPTSRALCVIGSDLPVMREQIESAAVLTRLAPSFIRFGSFEHWFYRDQPAQLKVLADYVIDQFYPALRENAQPFQALLTQVTIATARLMAQWQAVGFMHGVMNTDNMSILGLTLDYGPFGFMEAFDRNHICNHSDHQGRYAYAMQPQIGEWNCYALGQALLPLIGDVEAVKAALSVYPHAFSTEYARLMHAKLGLRSTLAQDVALFESMFELMQSNHVDFTQFFRQLGNFSSAENVISPACRDLFIDRAGFDAWAAQYAQRLRAENSDDAKRKIAMDLQNPKYILRNYLAQIAIEKAQQKDFSELQTLLTVLQKPFDEQAQYQRYADLPPDWASDLEVSCSS